MCSEDDLSPVDTMILRAWRRGDRERREQELHEAKSEEPPKLRAKRLGIRDVAKLERWDRIEARHVGNGLTQQQMAEVEGVSVSTIKKDFAAMKEHPQEFPKTCKAYT